MKRFLATLALFVVPALLVMAASASSAAAQDRPAATHRPRVVVLPTQILYGRIQRPNAFYVIPRTRPAPEERDLRTGVLREVVRSVQRAPF